MNLNIFGRLSVLVVLSALLSEGVNAADDFDQLLKEIGGTPAASAKPTTTEATQPAREGEGNHVC